MISRICVCFQCNLSNLKLLFFDWLQEEFSADDTSGRDKGADGTEGDAVTSQPQSFGASGAHENTGFVVDSQPSYGTRNDS